MERDGTDPQDQVDVPAGAKEESCKQPTLYTHQRLQGQEPTGRASLKVMVCEGGIRESLEKLPGKVESPQ